MDGRDLAGVVRELASQGRFLAAHDRAMTAIADGAATDELRHLAVLTLARAGATSSAVRLLQQLGLTESSDPEISGLHPRLLKDMALQTHDRADAVAAGHAYEKLWRRYGSGWHGVNVAAMALLAGDRERALTSAAAVRQLRDEGDYWSAATQGEAALLVGDTADAQRWLQLAQARGGRDYAARAATRRQLRFESAILGVEPALADIVEIPETIHFCGLIPGGPADEAGLRDALARQLRGVGFAFGGLAAGADIVIAEVLLELGVTLTVVLPFPPEVYVECSVRPGGEQWVARFHDCLKRAEQHVLEKSFQDDLDYGLASRRAMGLARLHARRLETKAWQLAVWDHRGSPGPAGTAADIALWKRAGGETRLLSSPWPRRARPAEPAAGKLVRAPKAVLFGDLPKFGELDDQALLAFYTGPLEAMGRVVDDAAPDYRNAWGDAVQLVFDDPVAAASCAFRLREAATRSRGPSLPPAAALVPRLALDFGGLHPVFDAVQQAPKYSGRIMTRASRIEPVTPPGLVYATEAFACQIALMPSAPVVCDYAGQVSLAKNFGILPLYIIRPLSAAISDPAEIA